MIDESQPTRTRRSDAERNRALLIDVARKVLGQQPRASMASIAAASGLGRNTIHRHFPTRQDLLDAVRLQVSEEAESNELDALRPAGELGSPAPARLLVDEVLNKVPPFRIGEQIVAEAQRLPGVTSAAIYLVELDGRQLRRLAGPETFPAALPLVPGIAVGPEIPREAAADLRAEIVAVLPNVVVAPMYLRGRATGVVVALGTEDEDGLRELAGVAATALTVADLYTDRMARTARARPTTPAAEIQQNMLPPRIVRVAGAMIAGNVTPGYELGGDWFDYAENDEGSWLGIADTLGTGPRTTAVATLALGAFRAERHLRNATPASVTRAMHATVSELGHSLAVAVSSTVALWRGATGRVQWVTCGALRPILVAADGSCRMVGEHNAPLGTADFPARLRIQSQQLLAGERMVFASDGILERADASGLAFGVEGIEQAIRSEEASTAAATVRALTLAARSFADAEFQDDATLIVLAPSVPRADGVAW